MLWLTIKQLESDKPQTRMDAARKLATAKEPRGIQALVKALHDKDNSVVEQVMESLVKIGVSAVPFLVETLQKGSYPVQRAAEALARIGSPSVDGLISVLLSGSAALPRRESAKALITIGQHRCFDALVSALRDSDIELRKTAMHGLQQIDHTRAWKAVLPLVNDVDGSVRQEAVRIIGKNAAHARAVEALISATSDPDEYVRYSAVEAMKNTPDPRWIATLIQVLQRSEWDIRRLAAEALGQIQDAAIVPILIPLLHDSHPNVRTMAMWALAEIDPSGIVGFLQYCAADQDTSVRSSLIYIVKKTGGPGAAGLLTPLLKDPQLYLRWDAAEALQQLGWKPTTREQQIDFAIATRRYQDLAEFATEGYNALLSILEKQTLIDDRIDCVLALSRFPEKRSAEAILEMLQEISSTKRTLKKDWSDVTLQQWEERCCEALGTIGQPAVTPLLDQLRAVRGQPKDVATIDQELAILEALRKAARCPICNRGLNFERKISGIFFGEQLEQAMLGTAYKCRKCSAFICVGCTYTKTCSKCGHNVFDVAVESAEQ